MTFSNSILLPLESTSLEWRAKTGLVRFTIPLAVSGGHMTTTDRLALGIITPQTDAVLVRLDYAKDINRFLELSIVSTL
jgi:hypothetical protein